MNIELAYGYFKRLMKAGQGTARGGKYKNRTWKGDHWEYDYGDEGKGKPQTSSEQEVKPKANKKQKIEDMGLDDLVSLYKEIKNTKGDKPDKVYNLIVQKDMQSVASQYKDKAKDYLSKNEVKDGDKIDGITVGKNRKGYYASANESNNGTPSMKFADNLSNLDQAVAVALAIKDSDNGWVQGKYTRQPLSEVKGYFS